MLSRALRRVALVIAAGIPGSCAGPSRVTPAPPTLVLQVHFGNTEFFEGEPINVVFEATNPGPDTAWTPPFGLGGHWLEARLTGPDGVAREGRAWWVDYAFPTGYRGQPLAPGRSLFETATLQALWGNHGPLSGTLYLAQLPPGAYWLTSSFNLTLPGSSEPREVVSSEPVSFRIRPRTTREDSAYAGFESLGSRMDVRGWQATMLDTAIAWVESRLVADSMDPFAVLILNEAFVKAQVRGAVPNGAPARIARIDSAIAVAQRDLPSGVMAAERLLAPWLRAQPAASGLVQLLGESLAGAVVREREASASGRP